MTTASNDRVIRVISVNPETGEEHVLDTEETSTKEVVRLSERAALAAPDYARRPLTWRARLLRAMADELEADAETSSRSRVARPHSARLASKANSPHRLSVSILCRRGARRRIPSSLHRPPRGLANGPPPRSTSHACTARSRRRLWQLQFSFCVFGTWR